MWGNSFELLVSQPVLLIVLLFFLPAALIAKLIFFRTLVYLER